MADILDAWFHEQGWRPFAFQREAWAAWAAGESGLIHAPTGTGKTLAALLGPVRAALANDCETGGENTDDSGAEECGPDDSRVDVSPTVGPKVLWVTPLRALAADTAANLQEPVTAVGLDWRVEVRSGDTPAHVRTRQRRRPPEILVTTPESLSLLLSYPDTVRQLATLETVVVDEWHELLGSKRGSLLELSLARLRALAPGIRTWGLSATLANLEEALTTLVGSAGDGRLVRGRMPRALTIDSVRPPLDTRFPWAGHLGTHLADAVIEAMEDTGPNGAGGSTLIFTNTRAQAELWFETLLRKRPDWIGYLALHHGSLDRGLRERVEAGLRDGTLRAVVATSSLDLGVDFSPVDRVIQIGSPKGAARLLQRAGRSGHAPGRSSGVLCVPTHALELMEIAAARQRIEAGRLEARQPLRRPLDVLAQHLVTVAAGSGFEPESMLGEVRTALAYADLGTDEWEWVLDFIRHGGSALGAYPDFQRVSPDAEGCWRITRPAISRRHRMAIGTITADSMMSVRYVRGGRLGSVEESFIGRLRPGDRFLFAGRLLELARVRDMTAYVRTASGRARNVPRWQGGRLPLSGELADAMCELFEQHAAGREVPPEVMALAPILGLQASWSALPERASLLVERVRSREGRHLFVYPFAGRMVHEGMAGLAAWRLTREQRLTVRTAVNDYGFELVARGLPEPDAEGIRALLSPAGLLDDLEACLNGTELARRQFREIARVAGLVFEGYPGRGKSTRQIQASSGLIFDVLLRHDPDNRLLAQARAEVLERQLEAGRLAAALERIHAQPIRVTAPPRLTPLAFPLWAERVQYQVSSESWRERVERMVASLERAAG